MYPFLFSAYLVAIVPIVAYHFVKFLKYGKISDIYKITLWSIIFSIAFYAIQWIAALLFCLTLGAILLVLIDPSVMKFLKRTFIFFYFILASQLFWIFPFIMSLIYRGENGLGGTLGSASFVNSFTQTVLSTATGNILYPLLTYYQRRIAFDYDWQLKNVFLNYFDYLMPLSIIFILVLFWGFTKFNPILAGNKRKLFIYFFASFLIVLYLSTVNIGFLKYIFLLLGNIPGFAIFRNFTDKFALAYIFIYSSLLAFCLLIIKRSFKFYPVILLAVTAVVLINFYPVKKIVVNPLWKTHNIYTTVNFPEEYLSFLKRAKQLIPNTTNVIAFPQNIASYAIVTEENEKNAYIGTSPFKIFTGINDLTGASSYPEYISDKIHQYIVGRNYRKLLTLLSKINVGYVMVTNNVPGEVKESYLFNKEYLKFQDTKLITSISEREVLKSEKGNYVIFKLKNSASLISSDAHIKYKKISPIKYEIYIDSLKGDMKLYFKETYHPGWKLYVGGRSIADKSHQASKPYGNEWIINSENMKKELTKSSYKENEDGSIDLVATLYFLPQNYFYIGIIATPIALSIGFIALLFIKRNEKKKKNQ